jgi:3-phenylpropionate/trans-cinnamate dioxygenase ferredoxin reductase subunit
MQPSQSAKRVVIVGAGHAGGRAAEALRAIGYRGEICLIGEERFPPYERPPLSKDILLQPGAAISGSYVRPEAFYAENSIDLRLGTRVLEIDRQRRRVILGDGGVEHYEILLLTTGARARPLPVDGATGSRVHQLRTFEDAMRIRELLANGCRLAVIGAGFIGLEVAAAARSKGCVVSVVEAAAQPLQRVVAPEIGQFVADLHRKNGVLLRTTASVSSIEHSDDCCTVHLRDGGKIVADLVVAGVGAIPNVELAQTAGLATNDGIVVDEFGRTSDANIYAAGDVTWHPNKVVGRCIRMESWQNAQNQAIAVAKVIAGGTEPYVDLPWFWSDQYDFNLQIAGIPTDWDQLVWRGRPADNKFTLFYLRDKRVIGVNTINNARDMRFAKQLIIKSLLVDADSIADPHVRLQDLVR